jgi:hypothetical protein
MHGGLPGSRRQVKELGIPFNDGVGRHGNHDLTGGVTLASLSLPVALSSRKRWGPACTSGTGCVRDAALNSGVSTMDLLCRTDEALPCAVDSEGMFSWDIDSRSLCFCQRNLAPPCR